MNMPDFLGAFWFHTQESLQTWDGRTVSIEICEAGILVLTSGKIVACDGLIPSDEPFAETVDPGSYPVILCMASGGGWGGWPVVACAMLRIKDEMPKTWTLATVAGESGFAEREGDMVGYGVDCGVGCFADLDVMRTLIGSREMFDWFKEAADKSRSDWSAWFDYSISVEPCVNIIVFSLGEGDGVYPSYFGHDANGDIVCLATDFGIIAPLPGEQTEAPNKYQLRLDL